MQSAGPVSLRETPELHRAEMKRFVPEECMEARLSSVHQGGELLVVGYDIGTPESTVISLRTRKCNIKPTPRYHEAEGVKQIVH